MFDLFKSIRWGIMHMTIYSQFSNTVLANMNCFDCEKKLVEIMELQKKIMGKIDSWVTTKAPEYKPDYVVNDISVWVHVVSNREYLLLGNIYPIINTLGSIMPFVNSINNNITGELLGFTIIIPEDFTKDSLLYNFSIHHELGHIIHDNFVSDPKQIEKIIRAEIESDEYAFKQLDLDKIMRKKILNMLYSTMNRSAINVIPKLKKRYKEKHLKLILKYDPILKRRQAAIA